METRSGLQENGDKRLNVGILLGEKPVGEAKSGTRAFRVNGGHGLDAGAPEDLGDTGFDCSARKMRVAPGENVGSGGAIIQGDCAQYIDFYLIA